MDGEVVSNRPESPKKKIKSNPVADSEAEPSNYSRSANNNDGHDHNPSQVNGTVRHNLAPTRRNRYSSSTPDSSSESSRVQPVERSPPRVQEEEVSSSENTVNKGKGKQDSFAEGGADSGSIETEDAALVCDSASSDSAFSDLNDKL